LFHLIITLLVRKGGKGREFNLKWYKEGNPSLNHDKEKEKVERKAVRHHRLDCFLAGEEKRGEGTEGRSEPRPVTYSAFGREKRLASLRLLRHPLRGGRRERGKRGETSSQSSRSAKEASVRSTSPNRSHYFKNERLADERRERGVLLRTRKRRWGE